MRSVGQTNLNRYVAERHYKAVIGYSDFIASLHYLDIGDRGVCIRNGRDRYCLSGLCLCGCNAVYLVGNVCVDITAHADFICCNRVCRKFTCNIDREHFVGRIVILSVTVNIDLNDLCYFVNASRPKRDALIKVRS